MSFITFIADFSTLFLHMCVKNFQVHCTSEKKKKSTATAVFCLLLKFRLEKKKKLKKNHNNFLCIYRKEQIPQILGRTLERNVTRVLSHLCD